jgi:integrase
VLAQTQRHPDHCHCGQAHADDLITAMLLLAGVPVHVVAARLGHADPSMTLRVYGHVINEQLVEAADIFAKRIKAA